MFNRKLMVKRHTSDYFPSILYLVGALEHLFFFHSVGNFISFQLTNKKMGSAQYGTTGPHWDGAPNGESWGCWFRTHRIHVYYIYMVTFTINIPQMLAYRPAPWIRSWGREANETGGLMRWRASCFLPLLDVAGWIWLDHDFSDQRWPKKGWELTMVDYDELWYRTWFRLITDWLGKFHWSNYMRP